MKKRKDKKCYISCKGIQKINYQRALLTRYSLMFTDALEDADIFFAPIDRDGLSDRQPANKKSRLKRCTLKILYRLNKGIKKKAARMPARRFCKES